MARAFVEETARSKASLTDYERAHVIRHLPVEKDRRYRELADKQSLGTLTAIERAELHRLVDEAERLSLENAQALLRHRDPAAFAALQKHPNEATQRAPTLQAKPHRA